MIVQAAENGKSYEVACDETTSIDMVQRALASLTSVGPADQVLICEGAKLESNRPLGSYGLPLDTKRVFLFNLAMLRGSMDSLDAAQQPEDDEGGEEDIPEPPSGVSTGHPLDEAQSPLLRALPFYERQFRYHHQKAEAVFHLTRRRFERCRALISEQEVQGHAIRAARENVDLHYGYICHLYGEFMRAFTAQHGRHAEILASFPRDMEALKSHRLHPSLLPRLSSLPDGRPRVTLADCVPDERLRAWAEDCRASHDRFGAKVASLQRLFSELQANVEEVFLQEPQVEIAEQEEALQESQRLLDEQASIVASLGQDERTVSKLVLDTMMSLANDESRLGLGPGGGYGISPTSSSGSSRPLDACAALDPMNEIHVREHLPVLEDCAEQLLALLARTREAKGGMSRAVFSQLRAVSGLQSRIRDLRNKLVAFKEICGRQQEVFAELLLVRRVPAAYRACLAEVRRRRAHAQVYAGQAAQLAERLADMRAAEVATRHSFARLHERYLPQEVLRGMGLYDLPAPCDVTIPPFDTNLIDLGPDRLGGGGAGVADDGLGVAAMLALLPPGTSQGLSGVSGSSGGIGGPFPSGSASSGSSSGASTGSGGVGGSSGGPFAGSGTPARPPTGPGASSQSIPGPTLSPLGSASRGSIAGLDAGTVTASTGSTEAGGPSASAGVSSSNVADASWGRGGGGAAPSLSSSPGLERTGSSLPAELAGMAAAGGGSVTGGSGYPTEGAMSGLAMQGAIPTPFPPAAPGLSRGGLGPLSASGVLGADVSGAADADISGGDPVDMELENARLRAELASAMAMIYMLDPRIHLGGGGGGGGGEGTASGSASVWGMSMHRHHHQHRHHARRGGSVYGTTSSMAGTAGEGYAGGNHRQPSPPGGQGGASSPLLSVSSSAILAQMQGRGVGGVAAGGAVGGGASGQAVAAGGASPSVGGAGVDTTAVPGTLGADGPGTGAGTAAMGALPGLGAGGGAAGAAGSAGSVGSAGPVGVAGVAGPAAVGGDVPPPSEAEERVAAALALARDRYAEELLRRLDVQSEQIRGYQSQVRSMDELLQRLTRESVAGRRQAEGGAFGGGAGEGGGVATGARQGASVASQGVEGGAVLSGREQGESVVSGQPAGEGVHGVTRRGEGEGAIGESGQPEERSGLVDGARPGSEDGLPPDASKGDGVHGGDAPSGTLSADRNRKLEKIVDAAAAAAAAVTAAVRAGECGECEREGGGQGVGAVEAGASDPAKHSDGDGGNAGGQGCVQRVASCQLAPRDSSVDASTMAGPGAGVDVCTMTSAATTVTTAAASTMTSATAITPVENTDVSTMTLAIASMPCDSTDASTMTLASAAVTTAAASTMTAAASSVMPSASMDVSTMTAAAATAAASTMTCAAAVSTAAAATMTAPAARSAVSTMTAATATTAVSTMTCAASVTNASTAMAPLTSADAGVGTDVSGSLGDVSAQAPDSALTAESGVGEDGETRTLSTATGTPHSGGGGSVDGSLCGGREDGFGEGEDVGEGGVEQTGQEAREGGGSATVPACGDREAAQEQSALREGGPSGLEREAADGQGDVAGPLPRGGDGMGSSHQGGDELLAHRGGGDDDMAVVQAELEMTREELHAACQLLEECQGNCTVLEARLREAREQVVTKSHAADRHATEYKSLRATTVRARGLLQRLQRCVQAGAAQVAAEQVSAGATVERVAAARPESGRGGRDPEESTRDGGEGGEGQEVETEGDGDSERARSVESDGGSASSMSSLHSAREGATRLAQSLRQLASSLAPPQERSGVGPLSHESSVEGQDLQHNRQGQQQRQEGPRLHEREGGNDGGLVQGDGEGGADWWAACVRALAEAVASIAERLAQVDVAREEAEASYLNLHAQVQQGLQQSMGEPPRGPGGSSTWQDPGGQDEFFDGGHAAF
eukprot:jgi/Mesvir1/5474/Mv15526-RA.2